MPQPIAYRSLVGATIAGDVSQRALLRDAAPPLADDDHDLALVVELQRFPGANDRLARRGEGGVRAHEDTGVFRPLAPILVLFVPLRVVDADAEITRAAARRTEQLHLPGRVVARRAVCEIPRPFDQARTQQRKDIGSLLPEPGPEVEDASGPERTTGAAALGPEVHQSQAARSSRSPARRSTPSSRRSSSGVAGIIGRRCSLVSRIPRRRIMYFIGIGLVSKNTAWLISNSRWCRA